MVNAIVGTLVLTLLATVVAVPLGLLGGSFPGGVRPGLPGGRTTAALPPTSSWACPPSSSGVFAYAVLVRTLGSFSGYAGVFALSILMLPIVIRTTEDMLRLVPNTLREAALALGVPRWRVTLSIIFRAAKSGLLTGILLAVARVSGETAPLLFTALNNPFMISFLNWASQPTQSHRHHLQLCHVPLPRLADQGLGGLPGDHRRGPPLTIVARC